MAYRVVLVVLAIAGLVTSATAQDPDHPSTARAVTRAAATLQSVFGGQATPSPQAGRLNVTTDDQAARRAALIERLQRAVAAGASEESADAPR